MQYSDNNAYSIQLQNNIHKTYSLYISCFAAQFQLYLHGAQNDFKKVSKYHDLRCLQKVCFTLHPNWLTQALKISFCHYKMYYGDQFLSIIVIKKNKKIVANRYETPMWKEITQKWHEYSHSIPYIHHLTAATKLMYWFFGWNYGCHGYLYKCAILQRILIKFSKYEPQNIFYFQVGELQQVCRVCVCVPDCVCVCGSLLPKRPRLEKNIIASPS